LSPDGDPAETALRQAAAAWWNKFGDQLGDADAQELLGRASLAALLQKEAVKEDDRATLAGVYVNRLAREIPLQSAAALRFGLAREGLDTETLTRGELRIDSPYNTYQRPGLPPSPICIPSESSWRSALRPENHDFLFVGTQRDGHLVFSRTYKDHIAALGSHP
ncbi:MAG TPA: endolytic transglycosylase MltG, partial [Synergistaceae bacterium]|nr:endolytic transglycosylase MltG [Synergistaceae bacterium]